MRVAQPDEKIRFGSFEADLATGELRKGGIKLKIQPQPFQVLRLLLRRPGEMISREHLRQELWPSDTYGEFDVSLNTVVNRLRRVLNDDPQQPRYIETLPRTGYRFIFPVEPIVRGSSNGSASPRPLSIGPPPTDSSPRPRLEVVEAGTSRPTRNEAPPGVLLSRSRRRTEMAFALALGVGLLVAVFGPKAAVEDRPVRRWSFAPEGWHPFLAPANGRISPDGKYISYAAARDGESSLWLRPLDNETLRNVVGTEGALGGFWSPDSRTIGFATDSELKRIPLDGADPVTICALPSRGRDAYRGATWSPDGERIVFSSGLLLYEVSALGGEPTLLFPSEEPVRYGFAQPRFLPSNGASEALVYTASVGGDRAVGIFDFETGVRRQLGPGHAPAYSPDGFLVYGPGSGRERGLTALPFSLETLESTGEPFRINDDGVVASFSGDGAMTYYDWPMGRSVLSWKERATGEVLGTIGQLSAGNPAISPDGRSVVFQSTERGSPDIWIADLDGSTMSRLTDGPGVERNPSWSPDGLRVAYSARLNGTDGWRILSQAADGTGEPSVLVESEYPLLGGQWSPDGRYFVYSENPRAAAIDILYVELDEEGNPSDPISFLDGPATEYSPRFSPTGDHLAYTSDDESGTQKIFVISFPDATDKRQVSEGMRPRWSNDGKELYYIDPGSRTLMTVPVTARRERRLEFGQPQPLFSSGVTGYAPSDDGRRFLTAVSVPGPNVAIHVFENWAEGFR